MITTTYSGGPEEGEIRFHHNGDFSGDVRIVVDGNKVEASRPVIRMTQLVDNVQFTVDVPFKALRALVLQAMKQHTISNIEQMSDDELWELMTYSD